jgi:DASS family divalent anion:Na+ symporter
LFKILTLDDVLKETEAWHTLLCLSVLVMMAECLSKFGFIGWFSSHITYFMQDKDWSVSLLGMRSSTHPLATAEKFS